MKAFTVRHGGRTWGAIESDRGFELLDAQDAVEALVAAPQRTGVTIPSADAHLAPVVPRPSKFICVGRNYTEHAEELGRDLPEHPALFARFATSLIGARDDVLAPVVSDQLDWEGELAVVIGQELRRACPDEAKGAILGYTVFNDVSVRDWQWRTTQWLQGKTFDRTGPLGPAIVTLDEVRDPDDLALSVEVDGVRVQNARTSQMIFSPPEIISYVSQFCTLEAGDVIATGTPGGVGVARDPQVFLRPGQTLRTVIEDVGECFNRVIAG
jgi:acylpyruvate hydrolase